MHYVVVIYVSTKFIKKYHFNLCHHNPTGKSGEITAKEFTLDMELVKRRRNNSKT